MSTSHRRAPAAPPPGVLRSRHVGGVLVLGVVLLVAAGWAAAEIATELTAGRALTDFDARASAYLSERRQPWLTSALLAVSWLANLEFVAVLVVVLGLAARLRSRSWRLLWVPVVAGLGALVISVIVKVLTARGRPPLAAAAVDAFGHAFPSGHSIRALAVYGALAWLVAGVVRHKAVRVLLWAGTTVLVLAVGFSRVYLGAHWPTDVLAGYLLGAVWLVLLLVVTGALRTRRPDEAHSRT